MELTHWESPSCSTHPSSCMFHLVNTSWSRTPGESFFSLHTAFLSISMEVSKSTYAEIACLSLCWSLTLILLVWCLWCAYFICSIICWIYRSYVQKMQSERLPVLSFLRLRLESTEWVNHRRTELSSSILELILPQCIRTNTNLRFNAVDVTTEVFFLLHANTGFILPSSVVHWKWKEN